MSSDVMLEQRWRRTGHRARRLLASTAGCAVGWLVVVFSLFLFTIMFEDRWFVLLHGFNVKLLCNTSASAQVLHLHVCREA